MKIFTRQDLATSAAKRWLKQFCRYGEWYVGGICKETVYKNLIALGSTPSPSDVDKVIGNGGWTNLTCGECEIDVDIVVVIGKTIPYEVSEFHLCFDCLNKATNLITNTND